MIRVTGAVLAGGMSLRMGFRKSGILLPSGKTMLHTAANLLSVSLGDQVVVSGREGIPDFRTGRGPMGGIESILHTVYSDAVVFIPCDMPFLDTDLIRLMVAAYKDHPGRPVVVTASHIEPLLAVVPAVWREKVTNAVDLSHLKVGKYWMDCGFTQVRSHGSRILTDVDYPRDIPA